METYHDDLLHWLQSLSAMKKQDMHREGWAFQTLEDLLLTYGCFMEPATLPADIHQGPPKQCYDNSQSLVFAHGHLMYVEGYAIAASVAFPVMHGWAVTGEGTVIDPTWGERGLCYFGVPFNTEWLRQFQSNRASSGHADTQAVFEGNHIEEFSLVRAGLPADAVGSLHPGWQSGMGER